MAELQRENETLRERTQALEKSNAKVEERNVALERENKILREQIALLRHHRFGRSSERLDAAQLALGFSEPAAAVEPPPPETISVPAHERVKPGHGRAAFAPNLPRVTIECDVPEAERVCACGKAMRPIGEDVSERGHIVPARVVVNRYVRKKYACPDGHAVKTAAAPEGVVDGAKYEASVYAHLVTAKYADHLPLHRLESMLKRQGVHLPKQTMWDMIERVDALLAQPVLKQMRKELLEEPVLHSDETPVPMRLEDGGGSRMGYAWGWRNLHEARPSKVLVEFKVSRSRDGPLDFLGDWKGTLIADGFSGYNEVVETNAIVRAGCWSHARRKFKEALDAGTRQAAVVILPIRRLFRLESAIVKRSERLKLGHDELVELRRRVRERRSAKVAADIFARAEKLSLERSTLPKSQLGKALGYLERQRETLTVFLADPRIPIHNNDEERDLRHLAIGRKNWQIFGSERGGQVACRLYALVLSCKQSGVDPSAYIEDGLSRLSTTKATDIASLTPWAWAAARS